VKLDGAEATIRHGLAMTESGETGYVIDADFYSNDKHSNDESTVFRRLGAFNQDAGRLFRWCISDRLHNAMQPQTVSAPDAH
jgi:uncharacterized protein (TIGR04255 family)